MNTGKWKRNLSGNTFFLYIWRKREAWIWIAGLLLMATMDPLKGHASLCPLNALGADWCPGCGLGHSIAWLFRGEPGNSLEAHFLGIPAIVIIVFRIVQILVKPTKYTSEYGTSN